MSDMSFTAVEQRVGRLDSEVALSEAELQQTQDRVNQLNAQFAEIQKMQDSLQSMLE